MSGEVLQRIPEETKCNPPIRVTRVSGVTLPPSSGRSVLLGANPITIIKRSVGWEEPCVSENFYISNGVNHFSFGSAETEPPSYIFFNYAFPLDAGS